MYITTTLMWIKKTFCYLLFSLSESCNELITNAIPLISSDQFFNPNSLTYTINIILDTPISGQKLFQDPGTNIFEIMVVFHHEIMFYMVILFFLILW